PNEALTDLDAARAALIEVERDEPNRLDILRPLIEIETARARIFENRDDWIEAVVAHEICVVALTKLSNADPKNGTLMADLASKRTGLAAAAHRLGDTARARAGIAAAAQLHEAALRLVPDDVGIAR